MKPFERNPATAIVLAALAGAFLFLAAATHAAPPTWQEELEIERSCEEWQKVRRCLRADGEVGLECVAKSPLAKFFSLFRRDREDDEVRVEVVRKGPEVSSGRAAATRSEAETREVETTAGFEEEVEKAVGPEEAAGSDARSGRYVKKVVRPESDLPHCGDDR